MHHKFDKTTTDNAADLDLFIPMYNLIEYNSNYSEIIGRLWFCSKDETTNVNADIANGDNFNSFKYNTKSLGKTDVDEANRNLRIAAIPLPLKYLSNFSRLVEMSLINSKIKLKLTLREYCVISAAGADDTNANDNNIIFTIKDTRLYVAVVTLSARDNQKLLKLLTKGFERLVYLNYQKAKKDDKNTRNEFKYFLKSNFVGVNRFFVLIY